MSTSRMLPRLRACLLTCGAALCLAVANAYAAQSPGCGLPQTPGVSTVTMTVNGVLRSYLLSVPSDYNPHAPDRLVFAWHGMGGSGQTMRSHNVEYGLPGVSVYPNALPHYALSYVNLNCQGQTCWDEDPAGQDMAFYDAMLTQLEAQFCINPSRVVHYGFSSGAGMTNVIACVRQQSARAVAVDAGWLPDAACQGSVSYWAIHADDDPTVPIAAGKAAKNFWRVMDGCTTATNPVSPYPCAASQGCAPGYAVTWCELPSGGHSWFNQTTQGIASFLSQY